MQSVLAVLIVVLGLTVAAAQAPDKSAQAALAAKALAAFNAKNWQEAENAFKGLVAAEPASLNYQQNLATAQFNLGHYADALASYDKAIALVEKTATGNSADAAKARTDLGSMLTSKGSIFIKQNKPTEAIAVFEKAAAIDPHPAVANFNMCAIFYNMGKTTDAVAKCDKAIALDPNMADAYFIKGSSLYGDATIKNGKIVVSDAALQALRKYLVLKPNGPHVADVKAMLEAAGQ